MYVCMYVCLFVCMYVCMYVCYCRGEICTLSKQTPIIEIINIKGEKNEGKKQKSVINGSNLDWN